MKFIIYCASACENENEFTQISGCGIILIHPLRLKKFEYGLGSSSKFRADLMCVRLALSSIKPYYRRHETILYVNNERILDVFVVSARLAIEEYQHEFAELMRWYSYYSNISVKIIDDQLMKEVEGMAVNAMRTQKNIEY